MEKTRVFGFKRICAVMNITQKQPDGGTGRVNKGKFRKIQPFEESFDISANRNNDFLTHLLLAPYI